MLERTSHIKALPVNSSIPASNFSKHSSYSVQFNFSRVSNQVLLEISLLLNFVLNISLSYAEFMILAVLSPTQDMRKTVDDPISNQHNMHLRIGEDE